MNLESFAALDEQITKEDWRQTPASVRGLLRWLFENYEERLADLEVEMALTKVESEVSVQVENAYAPAAAIVERKEICCSFCGKKREEVVKIIPGPNVCICNECVEICSAIMDDGDAK